MTKKNLLGDGPLAGFMHLFPKKSPPIILYNFFYGIIYFNFINTNKFTLFYPEEKTIVTK